MDDGKQGDAHRAHPIRALLRWAWRAFDSVTDLIARRIFPSRPYEVRYTFAGTILGFVIGLPFGGMGLATAGGAIGLSISAVAAGLLGLLGNRVGVERDLRAHKRRAEREP